MTPPRELSPGLVVQNLPTARKLTDYKLIAFDMDSTLINIECVDEIADAAGLSVAFHAKPSVRAQAQVAINSGGLDRLLEVLQP